jgi:hypothetical protein
MDATESSGRARDTSRQSTTLAPSHASFSLAVSFQRPVKAVTASGALLRPCAVGPNGPTQLACRARFANRRYLVVVVVDRPPPACFVVVVSPLPRASELPVVALGVVFTGK